MDLIKLQIKTIRNCSKIWVAWNRKHSKLMSDLTSKSKKQIFLFRNSSRRKHQHFISRQSVPKPVLIGTFISFHTFIRVDLIYNKMDLIFAIAIFGAIVATFDVYWVLRLLLCGLISLFRQTKSVTDVSCQRYPLVSVTK